MRPVEGRLVGFAYSPFRQGKLISYGNDKRVRRALLDLGKNYDPFVAKALLSLFENKPRDAVALLEAASFRQPNNSKILSDLAAAYLASAEAGFVYNNIKALSAAHRAMELNPLLPEAQFNLALALQRNHMREAARLAWLAFLEIDSESRWAQEARRQIKISLKPTKGDYWKAIIPALEKAVSNADERSLEHIASDFSQQVMEWIIDRLMPTLVVNSCNASHEETLKQLHGAAVVGQIIAKLRGDLEVVDSVNVLYALTQSKESCLTISDNISHAYRDYGKGRNLCSSNQGLEGGAYLERSHKIFARYGHPMQEKSLLYLAVCAYQQSNYEGALDMLSQLKHRLRNKKYKVLLGKVYWVEGMVYLSMFSPDCALGSYRSAHKVFVDMGDVEGAGPVNYLLAESLQFLGDKEAAWNYLYRGLAWAAREGDARRLYAAFDQVADQAQIDGDYTAALYFRNEVVRLATIEGDAPGIVHALLRRSETYSSLNRRPEAARDLKAARRRCSDISDNSSRKRQEIGLEIAEAKLWLASRPDYAVGELTSAMENIKSQGYQVPAIEALSMRARAFVAMGDISSAKKDLIAGIEEFELRRQDIADRVLRVKFFDQARSLFDLIIGLEVRTTAEGGNALRYAEQKRARVVLDSVEGAKASSVDAFNASFYETLCQKIPPGVTLVEYAWLEGSLIAWVIRNGSIRMIETDVKSSSLLSDIRAWRQGIEGGIDRRSLKIVAARLYRTLISPIRDFIGQREDLVIVPDKALHEVSFAALVDPLTRRYLIEDHAVGVVPSVHLWLSLNEVARQKRTRAASRKLLAIGNPAFSRKLFPDLPSLPHSEAEARKVASLYGRLGELWLGKNARADRLLLFGKNFNIIHFAGHAWVNEQMPSLSSLVLAGGPAGDGNVLYADSIAEGQFAVTEVVFLSGCSTARGINMYTEGPLGLARAFLVAGVPSVVANLWKVNDKAAAELSIRFHSGLVAGEAPAVALRKAQLSLLNGKIKRFREPSSWAGFQLIGT